MAKKLTDTVEVVAVLCENTGDEAVYVDGVLKADDTTIYMCDLASVIPPGQHITFKHVSGDFDDLRHFPPNLSELGLSDEENGTD